jgi:hypothetical protein
VKRALAVDLIIALGLLGAGLIFWAVITDDQPTCAADRYLVGAPELPDGWSVNFDCDPQSEVAGLANYRTSEITIWPLAHDSHDAVKWTAWHEIGHAYDHAYLTDAEREAWRALRGLSEGPWRDRYDISNIDLALWSATPEEDWAESFAVCHGRDPALARSVDFDPPERAECRLMRSLIRSGS